MTRALPAGTVTREVPVRWRLSRHSRRLLTLAIAGLLLAVLNRRPELVGVAAPALLLLGAGGLRAGGSRPPRAVVRISPGSRRLFEGEPAWLDLAVADLVGGYDLPAGAAQGNVDDVMREELNRIRTALRDAGLKPFLPALEAALVT